MASFWDMLGKAASVMQLTGVDAFGMVSMIIQAARTARRNRDLCQQLAKKVEIVSGLLEELNVPELRRHRKTRRPLDELFRGYVLVWSCSQQQSASQFWQMFMAADMATMLRQAKDEIDSYIILIPLITAVASIRARVRVPSLLHLHIRQISVYCFCSKILDLIAFKFYFNILSHSL